MAKKGRCWKDSWWLLRPHGVLGEASFEEAVGCVRAVVGAGPAQSLDFHQSRIISTMCGKDWEYWIPTTYKDGVSIALNHSLLI